MSRRQGLVLPSARGPQPVPAQQALEVREEPPAAPAAQQGVVDGLVGTNATMAVSLSSLPTPYTVPETLAPLTDKEREDLMVCEQALTGFRKALVIAGKALNVIRDGRLYRERYGTFEDYAWEVWGMRRSQAYRLIDAWPVAVAVSPIGDINEAQARELVPVFKGYGHEAGVAFFRETRELAGGKVTAAALAEARSVLPSRLAGPEQAADVLRVAAAEGRVPLIVPPRVTAVVPEQPEPVRTAEDIARDDVRAGAEAIAVLEAAVAQQQQIYDRLAGVVAKAMLYDPGRAGMLLGELRQYANRTAYRVRDRSREDGQEPE